MKSCGPKVYQKWKEVENKGQIERGEGEEREREREIERERETEIEREGVCVFVRGGRNRYKLDKIPLGDLNYFSV